MEVLYEPISTVGRMAKLLVPVLQYPHDASGRTHNVKTLDVSVWRVPTTATTQPALGTPSFQCTLHLGDQHATTTCLADITFPEDAGSWKYLVALQNTEGDLEYAFEVIL